MSGATSQRTPAGGRAGWLPRLVAIERCTSDGDRCEYLAWLLIVPAGGAVSGRFGLSPRDLRLWSSVDAALEAFGPGAVIDDAPVRHMTPDEVEFAVGVIGPVHPPPALGDAQSPFETGGSTTGLDGRFGNGHRASVAGPGAWLAEEGRSGARAPMTADRVVRATSATTEGASDA